ncbi:MAG: ABC transporter permease [Deltaproteobacteria bacterium HGW-Deltaproteobacteria-18]|jgi:tungstate transport system permease protein|nr:MAG: ABC transporter permease [Deltaproteobacteria bacterium HGW-Deltaproteobacteria-18]
MFFLESLGAALTLLLRFDPEMLHIVGVSLNVSFWSTLVACIVGVPAGFLIGIARFRLKQAVITFFNTMLALPTVVIGLLVYSLLSRRGVLGSLGWLYTQKAMVVGQIILITPIVIAFTIAAVGRIDDRYRRTALTLGASAWQVALVILREARFSIMAAVVAAFGRVISEIGISMMLGGNARGFTRTMTTAMALEYDKGEFVLALGLGIVLLAISLGVNVLLGYAQGRTQR